MKKIIITLIFYISWNLGFGQLQAPADFLGYNLGDKFTQHYRLVDYFEHVADASPSVIVKEYGKTYEGRPLILAFVGSAENIANLETIRQDNLKRTGLIPGTPSTNVSIVWLSYNVHGNEASSSEAAMATIYSLLTEHQDWLKNTVVIMDPCINPDGRERYVNFYMQTGNTPFNPDPQTAEQHEPWPGGRQNHYLFDLNRDWAWQTQIETQQRLEVYNQWMPHIHVDFHEQGYNSPYYFAPAAQPYHELITQWQRDFQVKIGKNHAKYFDKNNWFYFTKQFFDLLYPSYGDTYPTYNGAIGMTYEQAGHSGLGILKTEGDTLTLLDRLTHHTTTGLSTVEVASANAGDLVSNFEKFFREPVPGTYKSFVVKSANKDKMNHLKAWLDKNGIWYGTATGAKGLKGYNYATGRTESFSISKQDLVVTVNQPKGVLTKILFEPQTKLVDSLSYDITAWAVPYFYGMQAYATSSALKVSRQMPAAQSTMEASAPESAYAFFFEWNNFSDAQFLAALLKEDIKVRVSQKPIRYNGKRFERGTLIISKRDNKQLGNDFEQTVTELANAYSQTFTVANTGFMESGPDLGSGNVSYIAPPKIAMLRGQGVSVTNYGATWFYMEQELGYPVSTLNLSSLKYMDLSQYDVLIMQEGSYRSLGEQEMEAISDWVSNGGRLIAIGSAIRKFADSDYASISRFNSEDEQEEMEETAAEREEERKLLPYADNQREYAKDMIPGAIFKVTLDNTHPLAYGYGKSFYTLKTSAARYGYLNSQNVGVIKSANDLVSGFAGQYVKEAVGKSMVIGVENQGRGQIVYFVDNPLFRDFWYNYKLMFANALFLVGQD